MYTLLDDLEFEARFLPIREDDGAWRQFLWWEPADLPVIREAVIECRIWTMLDVDGECVLASGWHFVNRLHYVITERVIDPNEEVEVRDLD